MRVMAGFRGIQADQAGAACAPEVGMLVRVVFRIGTKAPDPVIPCYFMSQAIFGQPFQRPVKGHPIHLQLPGQACLYVMVCHGLLPG